MRVWVLVGVVLVGVAESEGSLEAWLRQIRSNDHHDSSLYLPRLPLPQSSMDAEVPHSKTGTGTFSEQETASNLQDLHNVPDEGVGPRSDEDLGKRTRRSDTWSYGNMGINKKEHTFSILALLVFASFLAYLVYYLVSEYKEKEERAFHSQDEVLTNLLRNVITSIGKWSLLEYLSEGVEDFDILQLVKLTE